MEELSKRSKLSDGYTFIAILFIAGFIVFKLPVLSLPYFWDEAWSYIPAISQLKRHGLSLLPGALPADVYRGHPLLYYCLAAGWMTVFGNSCMAMHSFALLITCFLFFTIFFVGRNLFSPVTGIVALILFMIQPMVLGQATFLLPEMLLAFWSLCCIYSIIKNKPVWYIVFASCLLYTKESGIVLISAILFWQFIQTLLLPGKVFSISNLKKFIILFLPVILAFAFYFKQKYLMGWYFFPDHIGMMSHDLHEIKEKFYYSAYLLFQDQSRKVILITAILFFIFYIIKSWRKGNRIMKTEEKNFFILGSLFILFYLVFCGINVFINRYLLSVFPVWCICMAAPMVWAFGKSKIVLLSAILLIAFVYYLENTYIFTKKENKISSETNLGFSDAVKVQRDVCDYLQTGSFTGKRIYATFLYVVYLTNPDVGYLHNGNIFNSIGNGAPCQADYIIYSSIEQDSEFSKYSELCKMTLVKRFERGFAWAELYKRNKVPDASNQN